MNWSCKVPKNVPFLNSFFKDLEVFIKGALDLVNRINAMRKLSMSKYYLDQFQVSNKLASRLS